MNPPPPDDEALQVLDDYLRQLQAGQQPDRQALLGARPELGSALRCLEALEGMAPPPLEAGPCDEAAPADRPAAETLPVPPMQDLQSMPRSFGPYELLAEIGRGGMGVVYKARQKDLDRIVALKMILASHISSSEYVRRFQVEARAAARMRHSNIVPIHEVGQCHGQHYFTMQYIEGQSLAERIEQQPLDIDAAVRTLAMVARAVEHLHQQNIVHRDLKPSNILLDADGQPYVTDFGLAKLFEPGSEMTATGVVAGTPSYMAPEQASGHFSEVGPAADIYSLGAILYELLTGQPPFRRDNRLDTLLDVLSRDPVPPRKLNPKVRAGLELICLKCLAKKPADRYGSAADLADDLQRLLRDEPLRVRPPHVGQRIVHWTRRQPALAARLGALGVFYSVGTVNRCLGLIDWTYHLQITVLLVLWILGSVICQQLIESSRRTIRARFAWGLLDSIVLLAVLLFGTGAVSSLVVGYPLLVAASGLWFRVRFVWYMTALSLASHALLVFDFYHWRPAEFQQKWDPGLTTFIIFGLSLIVLGWIVAYLVGRVRSLSQFCDRRMP